MTKLIKKFKRTVSVADARRSGRPNTATDEGTSTQVLAAMINISLRKIGISQSSVLRVFRANKHPYKLQMLQHLTEDDPDHRVEFYKANFYVSGEVNKQNVGHWMDSNPHCMSDCVGFGVTGLLVRAIDTVCRRGREICETYSVTVASYDAIYTIKIRGETDVYM
ncbi:hypothetical protein AVEN_102783-1 [Araneus ventricosus]|uniref:Uncharacterized protein n=1 Tax=Araneus ventricosus TaxID=182803 RepID=A0A4Y2QI04_ARAVE|nr:hypothetical protein AVEN_151011-1 [Araneus ventricosus]GBN62917.1 hypothetical protein AVEN_206534-1 [Araneus ventricosus]GBN64398.1 hypothetical protein AVEN_102783-1 [Araneus ventricosus]